MNAKTILSAILAVAANAIIPMAAKADEYNDSDGQTWSYTVGEDGKSVTLTGVSDKSLSYDAAKFPWTFQKDGTWYTVTNVAANACKDWAALSGTLSIPGTVKGIGGTLFGNNGDGAFFGCSGLTGLLISEGVETIGNGAFRNAVNATGGSGSLIIPSSVQSLGHDFLLYGGQPIVAVWIKGFPTVSSGTQSYAQISPYRMIYYVSGSLKTILIGPNTERLYSNVTMLYKTMTGVTVYLPANGKWDSNAAIGGKDTKVFKYGEGKDLNLDIDESAGKITATVKTTEALSAVLDSAANFKTYFGLDTRIEVVDALDIAAGTITAAQLQYATFNSLMLAVKTQDQLNSILGVVPASVPVSIDPTGATQNLSVSTADGRKVYVLLPENGTYKLRPDGLIISFH